MRILNQLRNHMLKSVPELSADPSKLQVWVDSGTLTFKTLSTTPSHAVNHPVNVLITEFAGDAEMLSIPLIDFVKQHVDKDECELKFQVEIIDRERVDVMFTVQLSDYIHAEPDADGNIIIVPACTPSQPWFTQ